MKNTKENRLFSLLAFPAAFFVGVFILVAQPGMPPIQEEFIINEPAPRTVFSPLYVTFVNEEETKQLYQEKESKALPIYTLDPKVRKSIFAQVESTLKNLAQPPEKERHQKNLEDISRLLTLVLENFLNEGILEDSKKKELLDSGKTQIEILNPETKTRIKAEVKDLTSFSERRNRVSLFLDKQGMKDRFLKTAILEIFESTVQPNLFFDQDESKELIKKALSEVRPAMEEVKRGEMVVQKGLLVTPEQQDRLIQIRKKMAAREVMNRLLTISLFVFLGLGLIFLYLKSFDSKNLHSPRSLSLILTTLFLTLAIERTILFLPSASFYLVPGALASILLTILLKPSLGVMAALSVTILSAPLVEFRPEILLMILLGSLIGSFTARGIRKRIQFLKVGASVGMINTAALVAFFLFQDWKLKETFDLYPMCFANGFLATAIVFFLIPIFEYLFNLTTDITLLELSDLNHPLLKRMVVEAPGTYHHSLVVSTLAEAACATIGANALLARVGCYFHDIGKIAHSEYFTENQNSLTRNKHDRLTPTMSCLTIMNHVKDGIELAKKYKLKDVIIQFIPEHQGTGVVYYFYRKALDQAGPGEKINSDDFRYPGPKPQSRETAVALLSDSVEAASRSLKEVAPDSIRTLVRKIINEKFIDGQLDECDLTLKDLHKIQESFVHNLMAIFHTRVNYPSAQPDPRRPDLFETDQFPKFH